MSVTLGRAGRAPRVVTLVVLGAAMLALQLVLRGESDPTAQVVGQLVAFGIFIPAAILCWRGCGVGRFALGIIIVGGIAFRAAAFVPGDATPPLSGDVHRYAWDGEVQLAGISPYRYATDDPALARLRDGEIWPGINHKDWHTIYPPGAQAAFVASQATFGSRVRASTWLLLIAEAIAIALLVVVLRRMRAPPERVAAYAWHPLVISEIAGNGHVDALAIVGLAGLLAAWGCRRHVMAGVCVAAAALVKLGPLLLVPALARSGGRRFVVAATALVVAAYIPYAATVGTGVMGSLRRFEEQERFNGSLDEVLSAIVGQGPSRLMLGVALLGLVAIVALREHATVEQVARTSLLLLGGLLLVVDYVQPWHALWLTPFLAIVAAPGWMWLTGVLPLAYLVKITQGGLPLWAGLVIYAPVFAAAVWHLRPARRPPAPAQPIPHGARVTAVLPALNEAEALEGILASWPRGVVHEIIVVDGGSHDATAAIAEAGGARVVVETRPGYGRACASGAAATDADVIVFLDADGSCDPADIGKVLEPITTGVAALSLGVRTRVEAGAMSPHQRVGNAIVCGVLRATFGVRVRDIPCLRAIRAETLASLEMREATYGWPTEMVAKTLHHGDAIAEVEVSFRRRRGGESKVAGRLGPSARAGARMLAVALRYT